MWHHVTVLSERLGLLESLWESFGQPTRENLAPGLAQEHARELLAPVTTSPPQDVLTWFGWHNGGTSIPLPDLAPAAFAFLPLALCIDEHARRTRSAADMETVHGPFYGVTAAELWQPTWLPLANDGGGGTLVVDLVSQDDLTAGAIHIVHWEGDDSQTARASSLLAMVDLWISALQLGLWYWDPALRNWDGDHENVPLELYATGLVQ